MDDNRYIGIEKGLPLSVDIEGLRPGTSVYCLSELTIRKIMCQVESAATNSKYDLLTSFVTGMFFGVILVKFILVGVK